MCTSTHFYKMEASEKVEAQARSDLLVFCRWSTRVALCFQLTNFAKNLPTRLQLKGALPLCHQNSCYLCRKTLFGTNV